VLVASAALNRWQIVLFGLFAALARAPFTPAASNLESLLKFAMAAIAYTGTGLLLVEMSNNRRRLLESFARVQLEQKLRRRAQDQLRILAESSPAAILTLNADADVLAANRAAHAMLGVAPGSLLGTRVDASWFSVYQQDGERCLAAIVVDVSEEVRDREREHFQHLLDYNRLLASAVSHEIRNLCSAISVVCSNLNERVDFRGNPDFDALVNLVNGLKELASFELRTSNGPERTTDLKVVLDQLRVVIEPDWEEIDGEVRWQIPEVLPVVAANAHGLLQIFLNLCQNSVRAVEGCNERFLAVSTEIDEDDVVVVFKDSGRGVTRPETLFQLHPVRSTPESDGAGLGLYISRELARSVGGDLRYLGSDRGAEFHVVIPRQRPVTREQRHAS
jgi:two-component system, LuxR family, sensor kinase FixL